MTAPAPAPAAEQPLVPTDPRIGVLLDFAQGLLAGYSELATTAAGYIPDEGARRQLLDRTQRVMAEARTRYCDIATGKTP